MTHNIFHAVVTKFTVKWSWSFFNFHKIFDPQFTIKSARLWDWFHFYMLWTVALLTSCSDELASHGEWWGKMWLARFLHLVPTSSFKPILSCSKCTGICSATAFANTPDKNLFGWKFQSNHGDCVTEGGLTLLVYLQAAYICIAGSIYSFQRASRSSYMVK